MPYLVYRTTNLVTGNIYIGVHRQSDPLVDDGYRGSGKVLKRAVAKYGVAQFQREVLSVHTSREGAYVEEARIVTEDFIAREDTYNLIPGGKGGYGRESGFTHTEETRAKLSASRRGRSVGSHSVETRVKISEGNRGKHNHTGCRNPRFGCEVTSETRQKIGDANRGKVCTTEHREKLSKAAQRFYDSIKGVKLRQHFSQIRRGRPLSAAHREALRQGALRRHARERALREEAM